MGCPRDALNIDLLCCKFISGQAGGNFLSLCTSQILRSINRLSVFTVNEAKLERGAFPGKPCYVFCQTQLQSSPNCNVHEQRLKTAAV